MRPIREILIATGNPGKYSEIVLVLGDCGLRIADCGLAGAEEGRIAAESCGTGVPPVSSEGPVEVRWLSLSDLSATIDEPVEDRSTFMANAALKARYYSSASGLWTLADDSGLEVDALGGAPGVRSARYAGTPAGTPRAGVYQANNRKLISAVAGVPPESRTARFRCVLALADGDRILASVEGSVEGLIVPDARGSNGFGYDPHFLLPDLGKTMAELSAEEKNRISHRGQALRRFSKVLPGLLG